MPLRTPTPISILSPGSSFAAMFARPVGSYTAAGIDAPFCSTSKNTWPPSIATGFVFTEHRTSPAVYAFTACRSSSVCRCMLVPWFERNTIEPSSSSSGCRIESAEETTSGFSPRTPIKTGSGPCGAIRTRLWFGS
ncbi:MAG TPA: hypothetical protein VFZ05_03675 [Nitrososphaera sp.]